MSKIHNISITGPVKLAYPRICQMMENIIRNPDFSRKCVGYSGDLAGDSGNTFLKEKNMKGMILYMLQ